MVLELAVDGQVIHGSIEAPGEELAPFHGWIELAHALELARARGREPFPVAAEW